MRSVRLAGWLSLVCAGLGACNYGSSYPSDPPGPPSPQTVQVAWCGNLAPVWVAFQDGDGDWTRALPVSTAGNTTFEHSFASTRGGIATLSEGGDGITVLSVLYGRPEELTAAGNTRAILCGSSEAKTLLGTVIGLGANEAAVVRGGLQSQSTVTQNNDGHFALKALPGGPGDLLATRTAGIGGAVTAIILRRDVDLPDSTTLPAFDFASAEAFAPVTANVSLTGLGPETANTALKLITPNTEVFLTPPSGSILAVRPYAAIPAAKLRAGDLQALFASAVNGADSRFAEVFFRSATDRTVPLPAAVARPVFVTVATTPSLQLRAQFVPQADYDRETIINYQEGSNTLVSIAMTAGYADLNPSGYNLIVPDLSGVPGFDPAWTLHPGTFLRWIAGRVGGTLGLGAGAQPTDGATQRSGFATDIIPGS